MFQELVNVRSFVGGIAAAATLTYLALQVRQNSQAGCSRHAGVVAAAQRAKLERLWRSIMRPAISTERLSLTTQGHIHYRLKTPYRDGGAHAVFEPFDKIAAGGPERWRAGCPEYFITRLAALRRSRLTNVSTARTRTI